jgi:hypothetical protein
MLCRAARVDREFYLLSTFLSGDARPLADLPAADRDGSGAVAARLCGYTPAHMAVDHYENFPVASILLPPALREPVAAIYWFARNADDFADEGDLPPEERRALLAEYQAELDAIERDRPTGTRYSSACGR